MKEKYYIKEVLNEDDVKQAVSFWERYLPVAEGIGIKKYDWFYQNNPYKKANLWLLKQKDSKKAIGVGGLGYRRFILKGEPLIGAIGVDFAIEKKYRTLGPALKLQRAIIESAKRNSDFLYGFPFNNADVILKYYKYQKIADFTRLVKILKSGNYLESVVKPKLLARAISIPADLLLWLRSIKTLRASENVFISETLEGLDHFVDKLWNLIAEQKLLMGERNLEYLNWRYFKCPEVNYKVFGIRNNEDSLQGFIVYFHQNKKVEIVDLICPDYEDTAIIQTLFANFEKYCFSNAINQIGINLIGALASNFGLTTLSR